MKNHLKNLCIWVLVLTMILPGPMTVFAQASYNYEDLTSDQAKIINKEKPSVTPAKPGADETAKDIIKNPDQPAIYTLRTDYKVQKGEKYEVNYQPYIASVGEDASDEEKGKVNKTIDLPNLPGYEKPEDSYEINYQTVYNTAKDKTPTGNKANGLRYSASQDFKYKAKENTITIKHLFQDMDDFAKYTNPGGEDKDEKLTTQSGNTGSTMEVSPLDERDRKGFVPEASSIVMQVPEDATDFMLEYRYNRAHYNVVFDTVGGTAIPTRTYYYDQEIPKLDQNNIPKKEGCVFLGWKPSHDLQSKDGTTYKAGEVIKKGGSSALDLDVHLKMPALLLGKDEQSRERLTFTAVWKDKKKANYAVQFWAEKADHADDASLADKYEYMGTHVYKDADTGTRPDLDTVSIDKIPFPDLDQARLKKIWNGDKFYAGQYLYLNKFFVYNKALTDEQNKDPKNVNLVKSVDSTGRTVYNIYYDRQVYDLYFTKSNALPEKNTFYPSIYVPDGDGGAKLAGGPGNPYHYKARFNQLMMGWPNDAMQTKGFSEGKQSYGWGPNYGVPQWPTHLDTPPYRLNADEFVDMAGYDDKGGYVSQIDNGAGGTIPAKDYRTLSFGIKQDNGSMPHHMDFWMDGFKPGETIIRYDLYRSKADTNSTTYEHRYSKVQGFTPYGSSIQEGNEENGRITEDDIDALNEERGKITPYPDKEYTDTFGFNNAVGQMHFRPAFFNNADSFGDPVEGDAFETNGYIRFKYRRNKYPLRFNTDPTVIKGDNEFGPTNQLDTFYEFPLKALSPDLEGNGEYKKDNPANVLDNPENLQALGLTALVFTDPKDNKLKVKRPDNLSDQMVFKGWALDPAGTKLIWENPKETMPTHPVNLYAKWGEPDYKWKVTFDPDGGSLKTIREENLTTDRKKIQEGDIGQEEVNTYAKKEANDGNKQVFTVIQRQKLVKPVAPEKKGYDFLGWEVIRYKKDAKTGDYTDQIDDSYRKTYKVPELYSFGNDVVSPIYLKAIWVPNQRVDVKVTHHFLDKDLKEDREPLIETLENKRTGYYTATTADQQNEKWILAPHEELEKTQDEEIKNLYKKYNDKFGFNNTYFQNQRIEPEKIKDTKTGEMIDNPKYKGNEFHFFYRPFRLREYKVNYIDERAKDAIETEKDPAKKAKLIEENTIIDQEPVTNGNRHYDARNYRPIPGWKLTSAPQQQLFFDVNEKTNEFLGINGTGSDEIFFYYKDVRVIEVPKDDPVPDGYVRVTFKADKGGSFGKDAEGKDIKELHYDVIKGLKSDFLPVPGDPVAENQKEKDKHYITPDNGKKFVKWDEKPLLNKNTIVDNDTKDFYVFTAKFDWSGLSASGLVRTEAFKDPDGKWTNDFAPKLEDLKKQLVWKEKNVVKDLPNGTDIKFYGEAGNELKTDDDIYNLVKEANKADKDELLRTVNIKAKVTFKDGKEPQELDIPIKVYKNVYEALTGTDKPKFLSDAEKDDLKDITGDYVKVTVNPTNKPGNKDSKIYYVNKNAWVNIPEVDISKDAKELGLTSWSANKDLQNENGVFDFTKRHKFTEDTIITPGFTKDVVEQTDPNKKPDVPDDYVKVIVKTTDKATEDITKIFWVNPSKEVTIPVANPIGKTVDKTATEEAKAYTFKDWKSNEETSRTWANGIKGQFTKETTITAEYTDVQNIIPYNPEDPITRPDGYVRVTFAAEKGLSLTEQKAYYVKKNAGIKLGNAELAKPKYTVETGYEFTNWDREDTLEIKDDDILVTAKAKVLKDFDTENHPGYVKVTFKAGDNGVIKENGNKINEKVYYVNPNKYVNLPAPTPEGKTGYDFGAWKSDKSQSDFSLANFVNYKEDTTITAMFNQKDAVYPKLDGTKKPDGYVEVNFTITGTGGKIADSEVKTYYVDPTRQVSLKAPKTIAGPGFIFDKWRLGTNPNDQIIKPADQRQYTTNTTIYGSFTKLKDIIPATNDDGTPNLQPIDYVAVLFIGGDHANKLDGQFLYYVNPKAKPAQTIGNLTKPTVTPDTGWKHTGWDVEDSTVIEDYTFVVAQYEALDDVIEKVDANTKKPDGYVTVTFKAGANGTLQGGEKTYYVNPAKYVNLTPPTTVPNTSYEFSTWESDGEDFILANNINYTKDTIITAKFNTKGDVIPKTRPDDSQKPQGFVTVTFVIDPSQAGKIEDGQTTTYFVNPAKDVTIQPPKTTANTGYEFEEWSIDTTTARSYSEPVTTVKGKFKNLDEIIPSKNSDGTLNAKPEGYVIVNFLKGKHGVLDGRTTFYVNPKAGKKLKDLDTKGITVVPSPTYKHDGWDTDFETVIDKDTNVTAKYTQLPNIIKAGPKDTAPDGYVVIIFETDGRGTITGNKAYEKTPPAGKENEIVYFVNPKKGIKLAKLEPGATPTDTQLAVPSTTPNDPNKYIFDQWRTDIDTETPIIRGRVHIATFKPKEVKLTYDANEATGTVPPELTVDYDTDVRLAGKGDLAKKDASFKGWKIGDKIYQAGDQINLKENTTAYAQWTNDQNIIPYDPVNKPTTRPDNTYVRVTFAADPGLKLTEQKAYYVKANAGITLGNTDLVKPKYTVETGYKFTKWDKEDSLVIEAADIVVTAKARKLDNVIPEKDDKGNPNEQPEGYKVVTFVVKTEDQAKGKLEGVAKFYVNPIEYVKINPPTTKANTGYEFGAWDQNTKIPTVYKADTTITASFNGFSDVIPKTKDNDSEKPDGYVTVTFRIQGDKTPNGSRFLPGETTVYYVDPNREVTLNTPAYKLAVGDKKDSIEPDPTVKRSYKEDTIIWIYTQALTPIIPSTKKDGTPNPKPDGYITVTFDKGDHGTKIEGQTVYYVNPTTGQTLADITKPKVTPETGWKQQAGSLAWDTPDTTYIRGTRDITVTARYDSIDDVIPKTTNDDSEKPDGYITVTFSAEENGKLTGTSVFYVNPNKAVELKDNAPKVTPNTGYDFADWDISINKAIQYKDKDIIKALYNKKGDVIPQGKTDGSDKPAGYVTVTFNEGDHGILGEQTVYYVNPNKKVTIPAPSVKAKIGYEFSNWNKLLTQRFTENTTITAGYTPLDNIIPQKNTDGPDKPSGYEKITFNADANGSLSGTTVYYVNPNVEVDLTSQADIIRKNPNLGYTAEGGTWSPPITSKRYIQYTEYTFNFKPLDDVIPAEGNVDQPKDYVKVEFIAGENGSLKGGDKTYYVNPLKKVKVGSTNLPIPEITPNTNYVFDGWYEKIDKTEPIKDDKKFVARFKLNKVTMTYQADDKTSGEVPATLSYEIGTEITLAGKNNLKKDNYVLTGWKIGGTTYAPGAKFTINENTTAIAVWETDYHTVNFDTQDGGYIPSQKVKHNESIGPVADPVKENHTFTGWKVDGQDFNPVTAKVEKDITLVAQYVPNVVEQTNGDKPQVPEDFVKVIVKTTEDDVEKATEDTKFERTFWVKKDTQVTITVPNPTGDTVKDAGGKPVTDVSGKEVKWNFTGWSSPLTASFTKDVTIITAKYDKTIPEPNIQADTVTTYVGKQPGLEDYKNALKAKLGEEGIDFATNVKETTVVTKPDVSKPGMSKARVQIEFNNGTTKTVEVPVKVNPNIYPADTDGGRTAETPANYVKVIVNPTILNADPQIKIYYVNPEADVAIPLPAINPQDGASFIKWYIDEGDKPAYNGEEHRFTVDPTTIVAKYDKAPIADYVLTEEGVQPKPEDYKKAITPPDGKEIQSLVIIDKPDVSKPGMKTAKIQVNYTDGTNAQIPVRVFVQRKPQTDWQTGTLGPTRTRTVTVVEKEIVKVPAEKAFRKEVRYMQGYNNYFRPGAGLTRAEAAQILANALVEDGYRYDPNFAIHYKDIAGNEWYAKAIRITSQANVFKGYDTGYFDPHKKITRAEWIGTLRRFQELERVSGNHMQVRADHWAMGEIEAAYKEGWLAIYGQGLAKFRADEFIPRQEVAAVSNKAFNRVLDKTYIHRNSKNLINYKDVNPSLWSYEDILCASNGFIHDGKSFWGHKVDYKKDLYNLNLDGYTVTKDKFQRLERR